MGATALGMGTKATRKILEKVTPLMPMSRRPMNPNEEQQFAKAVEAHKAALEADKDAACEMSDNDRVDAFDQGTEGVTEQTCYQKNGCWGSPKDGRNTKNNGEPIPWCYLKKKKGGTKKTASKARRSKRRLIATKTKKRR